jgi:hypothetical protein
MDWDPALSKASPSAPLIFPVLITTLMAKSAHPFLGFDSFEWQGVFYCFEVPPFGLSSAP